MIIVITGPTCAHKSEMALEVAKAMNAEIINADAFQVYKELNIGVAKPTKEQLNTIKHHLYSYIHVDEEYSIYRYQIDVRKKINALVKKHKNVILVGGSGLYIRAALYDYSFIKEKKVMDLSRFNKLSNEALHLELKKVDPKSALKIHMNNRKRVLRALEIYYTSGQAKSEIEAKQKHILIYDEVYIYAIEVDKETLYQRINKRVDLMFELGLVDEVKALFKKYDPSLTSLQAIGYKEFRQNLNNEAIKELIKKNTRHYAKRQMTFNRYQYGNDIKFIRSAKEIIEDLTDTNIYARTEALIGKTNLAKIKRSHVAVFGLGGVGGIASEALVRTGINHLYLIDHDKAKISNLNRQILFTSKDINKSKVKAAKARFNVINPEVKINTYPKFFNANNIKDFPFDQFDYVIDAIDSIHSKIALIKYLLKKRISFISSLGMGNRLDPSKLIITTLDKTHDDPLAKKLRNELKKDHIDLSKIKVVTSNEVPLKGSSLITSMMFVPSSAGLLLANYVIESILKEGE